MKLSIKGVALAAGILWGLGALLLGLTATWWGWGTSWVTVGSSLYIGYDASVVGAVIGGIWAFVDGLICGALFAWLYNKLS